MTRVYLRRMDTIMGNTYRVAFRFRSGEVDQYTLAADSSLFAGWNERIAKQGTVSFYDTDRDLVVVNTRYLETYLATKVSDS